MKKLRVLDLFSGIGGFSLGLERTGGFETIAFCEYEDFPRRVLAKHWPNVPCFPDVREMKGSDIDGPVDVICGGYPCQPFSHAGKRLGKEDDRHLWPEFARLVKELRPVWVIGENVAGHISMGLDDVLSDLEALGYTARPFVIPACAVGAKHRRDRTWTIGYANGDCKPDGTVNAKTSLLQDVADTKRNDARRQADTAVATIIGETSKRVEQGRNDVRTEALADTVGLGQSRQGEYFVTSRGAATQKGETDNALPISKPGKWCAEPDVGRVANGVPNRVDRLKALGNAVVPQIPEMIGYAILQAEQEGFDL